MNKKKVQAKVFEQIKSGLEDSIESSQGRLSLTVMELLAPPPQPDPRQ